MSRSIADNLRRVQDRISDALARSARPADSITLIAVTKSVGPSEIAALQGLGLTHFGENRVQTAEPKMNAIGAGAIWHMIGNIQRRKAKDVVRLFDSVDSVDRMELAGELANRAGERGAALPVLVEVNVSGESSKHGFAPAELRSIMERVAEFPALRLEGLMTMAPFYEKAELTRPVFAETKKLAETLGLPRISMGMSNDYEIAIEEGATEVRIGTALFEGCLD